jgi:hypothetical protein
MAMQKRETSYCSKLNTNGEDTSVRQKLLSFSENYSGYEGNFLYANGNIAQDTTVFNKYRHDAL